MKPHRDAMSLMEIIIVVLIIGLLAAVTTPRFSQAVRITQLDAAALQLVAHLNYLRRVALNESRDVIFNCDNDTNTYASDSVDFPQRIGELLSVSLPESFHESIRLQADFDGETSLTYDFEGMPSVAGTPLQTGSLTLESFADQVIVEVAAGTGVARIGGGTTPSSQAAGVTAP